MNASLVNIFIHNIVNFYVPQDYSYMNGENHLAQVSGVFKYVYVYLLGKKNVRTVVSDIFYFDLVTINATWIELEYTCTNTAFLIPAYIHLSY